MTKEELINHIDSCLNKLTIAIDACKEIDNVFYTDIMIGISRWLKEIATDINAELLPVSFYDIVIHNIQSLNINNLPDDEDIIKSILIEIQNQILRNPINSILSSFSDAQQYIDSYYFYKSLGFASQNTVLVGANGCGKTSLANVLQKTLNKQDGIVIPAQKLLIIPTFGSTPNYSNTQKVYDAYQRTIFDDKQTFNASKDDDIPYSLMRQYGAEYRFILSALLAERLAIRNDYCDKAQEGNTVSLLQLKSKLDIVIEIWNFLIEHRELKCDNSNNLILKFDGEEYPAWQMSDGERIILYLIGRVLLAPESSLIIVDEPEIYLHKTIVDKLWDRLEKERQDCVFIYLTHDLQFAASRQAKKSWIRSFTYPSHWDIETLKENEIPEELLLKLLGSRKKILFCEGKSNSLDMQIFEVLFNNYTITPVATCKDVINYTRAFNKIPNANAQAYGIIDRDFREQSQLDKLETENVYSYDVAEIENLFLIEDFLKDFAEYKHEKCNIENIKNKILEKLYKDKEIQASNYISSKIDYHFKESHVAIGNTKEELIANYSFFSDQINIEKWYEERLQLIKAICTEKNYEMAISIYNNKGIHSIVENELGLKFYRNKALEYLKSSKADKILLKAFPVKLQCVTTD